MSQTALTEDAPVVFNATKGRGRVCYYPRFATIHADVRKETNPDIVADARLLPFQDAVFDIIYCDPPHMIRKDGDNFDVGSAWQEKMRRARMLTGRLSPGDFSRYGFWKTREEWEVFLKLTNGEFARCLKATGELRYKILDGKDKRVTKASDLEAMTNFTVTKRIITDSASRFNQSNKVHWLTMKKAQAAPEPSSASEGSSK